ncbi:NHLP bacteriocin system secretion protein [Azospirillum sp. YIM B02556]|uniref:NHLP bacteriocin system secretion protein n=1 Tax=Azospirillum endophyticum TaxID=2800326 RepID=A0ABS1FFU1_9PROT|nr:NHLP bacteriocin system secretion protein [Azospirillum endophyticum]MBK1842304.1 NHLP bacteriocin system secretion protein [Azospirillum endophyticum]
MSDSATTERPAAAPLPAAPPASGAGGKAGFRAEAAEAATSVSQVDDALEVVRPPVLAFCVTLALLVVGVAVWASLTDVPIKVTGQGILVSPAGVIDVVSESNGRINDIRFKPGDVIRPGDVVALVDQSEQKLKLAEAEGELQDALAAREDMRRFQDRDFHADEVWRQAREQAVGGNIRSLQERQRMMTEREELVRQLADRGLTTRDRAIAAKIELFTIRSDLETQRNELQTMALDATRRQTQREKDMLAAEQRVATASRAVESARDRLQRYAAILSPYGGRVVEAKANIGQVVSSGAPIVSIERDGNLPGQGGDLVALVYVGAQDGKKLRHGMEADVSPAPVRKEEHGHLVGRVDRVADTPASSAGMLRTLQNDALVGEFQKTLRTPFEILIRLERDPAGALRWSTGNPPKFSMDGGTLVSVEITVQKVRLIALALPILQQWLRLDLTDSMAPPPAAAVSAPAASPSASGA